MTKVIPLELTIIILNYNTQFWLKKTLTTLKEQYLDRTKNKVKVVVVDNNSQDETLKMLRDDFSWVEVVALQENVGYARGNNIALEKVATPYAMLLNSDVEFTENSNLDPLLSFLEAHSHAAVVTPKILLADSQLDLAAHRGEPTLWASLSYYVGLEKVFPFVPLFSQYHLLTKNFSQIHEIDACSGAAMIVRTSAMKKIGYLDERFFMYAEDLDWCKRFREAKYQIFFHPEATVTHHKYKSGISSLSQQTANKTRLYFYETMLQYYDKHYQNRYPKWVRQLIYLFLELKKGVV